MIISIGYLHSAIRLIEIINKADQIPKQDTLIKSTFLLCPTDEVVNLSIRCGWLQFNAEGQTKLTTTGHAINDSSEYSYKLQTMLKDFIKSYRPTWGRALYLGRFEFCNYAPPSVFQCFKESNLLQKDPTRDIIEWWDDLSSYFRSDLNSRMLEIGRTGERLTIEYEHERTGIRPTWQAIESNLSGYDILSVVSRNNPTPMQIEVKSTEQNIDAALWTISSREWEQANNSHEFRFYLWMLTGQKRMAALRVNDVMPHIPTNSGKGSWESTKIPYSEYEGMFSVLSKDNYLDVPLSSKII